MPQPLVRRVQLAQQATRHVDRRRQLRSHPPEGLLRAVNPTLRFLLRTPLAGPARQQLMVMSFRGRKTGNRYSIPVSAHLIDHQLYALAGAPWTRNFRGGAAAEVVHDGKTTTMNGELIEDPAAVADLSHRLAESYGVKKSQRMMGLAFRDQRIPTVEEFKEAAQRERIVAVLVARESTDRFRLRQDAFRMASCARRPCGRPRPPGCSVETEPLRSQR